MIEQWDFKRAQFFARPNCREERGEEAKYLRCIYFGPQKEEVCKKEEARRGHGEPLDFIASYDGKKDSALAVFG